jgi:CHAT domain-containing protein/ribosomal protein S17E
MMMDEQRQQAYLQLVQELLICETDQEAKILAGRQDLVDGGLVTTALAVAKLLAEQGGQEAESMVDWLVGFAQDLAQHVRMDIYSDENEGEMSNDSEVQVRFLEQVLQSVSDSSEDPKVIYPLLRQNLRLLNDGMIVMLRAWASSILAEAEKDLQKSIAEVVGGFGNLIQQFPLGSKAINMDLGITAYKITLEVFTVTEEPEAWAALQNNLAIAYLNRIKGDRSENLENAIVGFDAALEIRTKENFPIDWALTQNNLANAYYLRIKGDRAKNLENAIAGYDAALEIRTKENFPIDWAWTQNNLANAYYQRIEGDRAKNLENAIDGFDAALMVLNKEDLPIDWSALQNNRSLALIDRIRGDKGENLENAIAGFNTALKIRTKENFPTDWADTQYNSANAYYHRIKGDRAENLENAIAGYDAALEIYTKENFPIDWAMTQSNLANAYSDRIKGDEAENLENAIAGYDAALEIRTKENFPIDWAMTQSNLAAAYSNRIRGDRAENLENAIAGYDAALEIRTKENFPIDWAMTQSNLAAAYSNRIRGDRAENLENAIADYDAALEIRTKENSPINWAYTTHNRATAYSDRIKGDRAENLEDAIAGYQAALEIYTPHTMPIDCLRSSRQMGDIYFIAGNWQKAIDAYQTAIQAAETSRSWSVDEDEKQRIIREALSVYENTIQAQINLGQIGEAIITSERARSRQLVDFMATKNLSINVEISSELQEYLLEYDRLQLSIYQEQPEPNEKSLSDQQLSGSRSRAALQAASAKIQELETQKQQVWKKIRQIDPILADQKQVSPIDLATIQSLAVTGNTAILSFYTTDEDTHIFIIRADRDPQIHTCPGQGLASLQEWLAETWLNAYTTDRQEWLPLIPTILAKLADRLKISELIAKLPDIQELILIPHLYLHQIPFSAMPIPESGELLGDKFTIRYAPSCQILHRCLDRNSADNQPTDRPIQHGTVENADGTLPGAALEGEYLANLYQIQDPYRLQGRQQATLANFQNLLKDPQNPVTNLHTASHASSRLDNPLANKLVLADGELTLDRLLISRYPQLQEVFLSCCETHLGTTKITDDLLTLGTGFLCAGARTVISSLWAVDDIATALFCRLYYQNRHFGDNRSHSLQKAQASLRSMSGTEFQSNHSQDFKTHLAAYARANKADRRTLQAQKDQGEIAPAVFEIQQGRLLAAYEKTIELIGLPGQPGGIDQFCRTTRPFEHPYYWAGFICQGLG